MQLHSEPIPDATWQGEEIAADATHRYVWAWYGYNIRLFAVARDDPFGGERSGADWGWCYPRDPDVVRRSVAAWDPDTQDEPRGWHKRPGANVRRAPRRYRAGCAAHGGSVFCGCAQFQAGYDLLTPLRHPPVPMR